MFTLLLVSNLIIGGKTRNCRNANINCNRGDKLAFPTSIFNNFRAEVLALIQCDDREAECPGLTGDHPDVTTWDTMSGSDADKVLIPGIIRLIFHDCGENDPLKIAQGDKNAFQFPNENAAAGGCNGCLDLDDHDHSNLLDGTILPFKDICDYYYEYISRADCWALSATIASEYSASILSVRQGFPFEVEIEAAINENDIPYFYGRTDCVPDDISIPWFKSGSFSMPIASQGWAHMSDFFQTRFGWQSSSSSSSDELDTEYFTNRDIVAIIAGGHSIGRAHEKISGFSGQWDFTEDTIDNMWIQQMFNEDFMAAHFGLGRPARCWPGQQDMPLCTIPYDEDNCIYDTSICPWDIITPPAPPPDCPTHICQAANCDAHTSNSAYYLGRFRGQLVVCEFFKNNLNWNQSTINIGNPQFGVTQNENTLSLLPTATAIDPPLLKQMLAMNTDVSLLWDISYYLEQGKHFEIDCNTHAKTICSSNQTVLTANRSQNSQFTKFNIGKTGQELGEIYVCPTGETCCEFIQCPVQCQGGLKEYQRLLNNDLIDSLPADSDCIIALAKRYSTANRDNLLQNRRLGEDYSKAFIKMITIGYYDREDGEYNLLIVGEEDDDTDNAGLNLITMQQGQLVLYSMLMVVAMITLFCLCVFGYWFYQRKLTANNNVINLTNEVSMNDLHFANGNSVDLNKTNSTEDVVPIEF